MLIANPIYDNAFKFLMEDINIAKGIIGRIIGCEILELDFKPQEYTATTSKQEMNFLRMDFHALILTKENEKRKVLIELQKSKKSMDLFRFRKYIGEQYQRIDNILIGKNRKGETVEIPEFYSIIVIYFLGYIEDERFPKVVKLKNHYYDVLENKEIPGRIEFLEKLNHESYMLQLAVPQSTNGKKPLERMLTVFSETGFHSRVMEYPDDQPEEIQSDALVQQLIRRLYKATQDEKVRKQLEFEEEMERKVQDLFQTLEENAKELEENRKALDEKDKALDENRKVIFNLAKMLRSAGVSEEEIRKQTGLSMDEMSKIT
ncbi:MAG: hypothetical protein H7A23_18770 [Leptospiraceae bacterium]|nr:hypothetical protein [Leptospiraceae bacterium]MCP5496596.1 hypothetical protein [Leptospiraceae bacterium]